MNTYENLQIVRSQFFTDRLIMTLGIRIKCRYAECRHDECLNTDCHGVTNKVPRTELTCSRPHSIGPTISDSDLTSKLLTKSQNFSNSSSPTFRTNKLERFFPGIP